MMVAQSGSAPRIGLRIALMLALALTLIDTAPPTRAAGGPATLVKTFTPQPYQPGFSVGSAHVSVNGTIFVAASDDTHGEELWKSDGTAAGTVLVKDIQPGLGGSSPTPLTSVNGKVLFFADDGSHGQEPWVSDGTAAGTVLLKDIDPGPATSTSANSTAMVVAGSRAFFVANDGIHDNQLWASDGTAGGTHLVKDIITATSPNSSSPTELTNVDGTLYFIINDQNGGAAALWRSDGSEAGTIALATFTTPPLYGRTIWSLTAVGRALFFWSSQGLWRSDGTAAGTIQLSHKSSYYDLIAGSGAALFFDTNANNGSPQLWGSDGTIAGTTLLKEFPAAGDVTARLSMAGGALVFLVHTTTDQTSLWKSDGSAAGTIMLEQFATGARVSSLADVSGAIFLAVADGQPTIWKSDGTAAGTVQVAQISGAVGTTQFTDGIGVAGRYVLTGCDGVAGCQIWGSDGSAAGTTLLWGGQPKEALNILGVGGDIAFFQDGGGLLRTDGTPAGTVELKAARLLTFSNTVISEGLRLGGRLIFTAESGTAVWASDGTTAGTLKLMGLSGSQGVGGFTRVGDTAFFFANAPPSSDAPWADNRTLWASDGTPAGTRQLVGGLPSHPIKGLTSLGNALFFIDRDDAGGQGLWRSDGTPAGTTLVKGGFYSITSVLPFADRLVFTADGQLWRSDGTAAGTTLISKDGEGGLVSVGGTLFSGICGPHTCALWASDGTAAGTRQLRVFDPPGCDRFCDQPTISDLVGAGGTLFFNASLGGTWGFWASDGTAAGTRLLSRTLPFYLSTSYTLPAIGGRVFFIAANDSHGLELWTSDGSPAGTHLVKDIWPGAGSAAPRGLTAVGNRVFFSASDDAHGRELWVSDGTAAGTQLVADINPGPEGSMPDNLTVAANGQLFFSATDGVHGTELWVSDSDGTRMVQDINPGADGASPATITAAGPNLFFSANDGAAGPALWTLPLTTQPFQRRSIDAYALIQAEDFDRGGESLAYHDTTPGNHNGAYRPDEDVDLQTAAGETYLAYAQPGEWLNYTVDIAATRVYTLELAVASLGPGGSFHLELDGTDLSGPLRVPDTGGWNRWAILSRPALSLPAGRHTLRLVLDTPGASGFIGNIDWLALDGGGDRSVLPAAWR